MSFDSIFASNKTEKNSTSRKIAHIVANKKTATVPMFIGIVAAFSLSNCQRWDYNKKTVPESVAFLTTALSQSFII